MGKGDARPGGRPVFIQLVKMAWAHHTGWVLPEDLEYHIFECTVKLAGPKHTELQVESVLARLPWLPKASRHGLGVRLQAALHAVTGKEIRRINSSVIDLGDEPWQSPTDSGGL